MNDADLLALAQVLLDLDRCWHGRHEGDNCFSCPDGRSPGNPHMRPGQVIGYGLSGELIVMPTRDNKYDVKGWRAARDAVLHKA